MQVEEDLDDSKQDASSVVPLPKCFNKDCQMELQTCYVSKEFLYSLQQLLFHKCQQCEQTFAFDKSLDYFSYVKHLTQECSKLKLVCPLGCNQSLMKMDLKQHLANQECQYYFVSCVQCEEKVQVKDRLDHQCALEQVYSRAVQRVVQHSLAKRMCQTTCKRLLQGHTYAPTHQEERFVLCDRLCDNCSKSDLIKNFEEFKLTLQRYFKTSRKGKQIVSPYHYYKLDIIAKRMKELDPESFEENYRYKMKYLRQKVEEAHGKTTDLLRARQLLPLSPTQGHLYLSSGDSSSTEI